MFDEQEVEAANIFLASLRATCESTTGPPDFTPTGRHFILNGNFHNVAPRGEDGQLIAIASIRVIPIKGYAGPVQQFQKIRYVCDGEDCRAFQETSQTCSPCDPEVDGLRGKIECPGKEEDTPGTEDACNSNSDKEMCEEAGCTWKRKKGLCVGDPQVSTSVASTKVEGSAAFKEPESSGYASASLWASMPLLVGLVLLGQVVLM